MWGRGIATPNSAGIIVASNKGINSAASRIDRVEHWQLRRSYCQCPASKWVEVVQRECGVGHSC